jgi:enoyl-CoA hydratase/carnithine racemase
MDFENVIVDKDNPIAVITLNRPQLNALSYGLFKDLSWPCRNSIGTTMCA